MPNDSSGRGSLRGYNSMQLQMGIAPQGYAPQPLPTLPMPPSPMMASQMLLQQSQSMSPMARPQYGAASQFSSPMFGTNRGMAHQNAIHSQNQYVSGMQTAAGVGTRFGMGAIASTLGGVFGGPIGALAAGSLFDMTMGQSVQNGAMASFNPVIQQRNRGLQMQNMSQNFIRSGPDMSMGGQGLSMQAAQRTANRIRNMAQDDSFQASTRNMFNTQDVMKISRMASSMGMLDQAGSSDQITRDLKKISQSLSNFMKLAGEPDIQQAMQQMSNMRNMGMSFPEISVATNNARQFARMAGVDTRTIMQQGMQGAQAFQMRGLSGAAGMNAAMGAQGFAGLAPTAMSARQLAMAGGQQGVASTLLNAGGHAATMDVLLPSILSRQNGQLGIDQDALRGVLTGDQSIQQLIQQGAGNMQRLGGRSALQELATRRRELQDQASSSMSPQMQMLLPMVLAQRTAQGTPGMSMGGALRTMGYGEQQARTIELMAESPDFKRALLQQEEATRLERRELREERRAHTRSEARTPEWVRDLSAATRVGRRMSNTMDMITNELAYDQDMEEEIETRGGRVQRVLQRDTTRTSLRDARRRDRTRADPARFLGGDGGTRQTEMQRQMGEDIMQQVTAGGPASLIVGPEGIGFSQASRGGEFLADTVARQEDLVTRGLMAVGVIRQSPREVRQRADEIKNLGDMAALTNNSNVRERVTARQRSVNAITQSLGRDMDPAKRRAMTAQATSAIRGYLDDQRTFGLGQTGRVSMGDMTQAVRARLSEAGYSTAEITAMTQPDVINQAMLEGRGSYTPAQQEIIDNMEQAGSESSAATQGQTVAALRQGTLDRNERVLGLIGMGDTGFFSDITEEDQRATRDLLGGGGNQARVGAAMAMLRSGDEATKRAGQEELSRLSDELGEETVTRMRERARTSLDQMDEETVRNLGGGIGERGLDTIVKAFGKADEQDTVALNSAAMTSLVGGNTEVRDRIQNALRTGDREGASNILRSYAENTRGITSGQRERLKSIADSGDFEGAIETEIARGSDIYGGEGASDADDGSTIAGIMDSLGGGPGGATQGTEDGVATPSSFEEAVVMFSEATRDLKEAAEQFSGDRETSGLSSLASMSSPVAGLLNLFGSD